MEIKVIRFLELPGKVDIVAKYSDLADDQSNEWKARRIKNGRWWRKVWHGWVSIKVNKCDEGFASLARLNLKRQFK